MGIKMTLPNGDVVDDRNYDTWPTFTDQRIFYSLLSQRLMDTFRNAPGVLGE